MKVEIEKTADGSPTLYRGDIDEHYHSVKGALIESSHVYVDLGWRHARPSDEPLRVFEVGFGTGLNAALTAMAALESRRATAYYTIELYPLSPETIDLLVPFQGEAYRSVFQAVNAAGWGERVEINPWFTLIKLHTDLLTQAMPAGIDIVYFDAFAPEKQPEMWTEEIFRKLHDAMKTGAILTTYCAKGAIRRLLQSVGFLTERLPGPPAGKREVLRATKP